MGWKLSLVLKDLAPSKLLDTYQEERIPVIAEMLNKTTELHKKAVSSGGGEVKRGRDMHQLGVNYRGSSILHTDFGADDSVTEYPGYNIESETAAQAGDRAPEAPGLKPLVANDAGNQHTSFFSIFSPSKHTVLIFSDSKGEIQAVLAVLHRLPKDITQSVVVLSKGEDARPEGVHTLVVVDDDGHARRGYKIREGESVIVVVRPDGVVGARVRDATGVGAYFQKIFA